MLTTIACQQGNKEKISENISSPDLIESNMEAKKLQEENELSIDSKIHDEEILVEKEVIKKNDEQSSNPKADTLLLKYKQYLAERNTQTQLEYIKAFPSSFKEMRATFGFDTETGAAPHYDHIRAGGMIKEFSDIQPEDKNVYYNKYIDICVDAIWEADNIVKGFEIYKQLIKNPSEIYPIFNQRTDKEIMSVFRFIFDGPHPNHDANKRLHKQILNSIPSEFQRMKKLLNSSFEKLLSEDHDH